MRPLLVLLAGTALAAGPSVQVWADASGDDGAAARSGPRGYVNSVQEGATPRRGAVTPVRARTSVWGTPPGRAGAPAGRTGTVPAPPPLEVARRPTRVPVSQVRAVILTVANGEQADPPTRSTFLSCRPVGGSHPSPEKACARLNRTGTDLGKAMNPTEPCTMIYAPVTVTASGIWDGKYFQFRRTFGNDCEKRSAAGALFDF